MLRHPAVAVAAGTCYGRLDVALEPGWEDWAAQHAATLAGLAPQRIWSSPSARCLSVAEALGSRLGLGTVPDARLLELDFGEWEGRAWEQVPRAALDRWAADPPGFRPPGGESGAELVERIAGFARMLAEQARPCAVVSHGGPLRLLPALLLGDPVDLLASPPALGALRVLRVGRSDPG